MTTLINFTKTKSPKGVFYWFKFYWFHILEAIYSKKVSKKVDNWKGIKVNKSVYPKGWTSENAFKYLEKEYNGKIMKRFAD